MAVFCAICSTCNAADITAAADATRIVAIFDNSTDILPRNAADIIAAADTAFIIAICYTAAAIPRDAANIITNLIVALNPAVY